MDALGESLFFNFMCFIYFLSVDLVFVNLNCGRSSSKGRIEYALAEI